jgi:Peptidase M50B-like
MAEWMWSTFRKEEWIFLGLFLVYYTLIHCLYDKAFLKPMKLLGVFVHEMGHASATWLTCGKVKNIEVYQNEGGITGFSGGWRPIIIPAGYVGGAFWGGCFVALSGFSLGAMIAAFIVSAALLVALWYVWIIFDYYMDTNFFLSLFTKTFF